MNICTTSLKETRSLIDADRFHEVRYERLTADPVSEMKAVYQALDLGNFAAAEPAVARYAQRSKRYRANEYEIDAATCQKITRRWAGYLTRHGYLERESAEVARDPVA